MNRMLDLAPWHDFWLFVGGASATLAGLVFVALTLRMREILGSRHAVTLARGAFYYFLTAMGLAAILLAPWPDDRSLAIVLLIAGSISLVQSVLAVTRLRNAPAQEREALRAIPIVWRLAGPVLARVMVLVGGVAVLNGDGRGQGALAVAALLLVVIGAGNAWDLVTAFEGR